VVGPRASGLNVLYVSEAATPHDRRFLAAMAGRLRSTTWLRVGARVAGPDPGPLPAGVRERPAVASPAGVAGDAARQEAVREAARETRPDVVLAGPVPTSALAAVRAAGKPVIAMAWGSDVLLAAARGKAEAARAGEALRGADGFVGDARCVEEAAAALGLPASTPRAVFPWGLEEASRAAPPSTSPLRRRLGWEGRHVAVAARAWSRAYRVDVLLEAFEEALAADPDLRLLLLGEGDEAPLVRARSAPWVEAGRAVLAGHVTPGGVRAWFEAADVYVSAVPADGSSISLLEAMALAKPPVVADAFGNREWVEPGRSGWLVPPGDAPALARALVAAFRDPASLRAAGGRARETVLARARWEENVERLFALFEEVA
jgi:hypothetical protein